MNFFLKRVKYFAYIRQLYENSSRFVFLVSGLLSGIIVSIFLIAGSMIFLYWIDNIDLSINVLIYIFLITNISALLSIYSKKLLIYQTKDAYKKSPIFQYMLIILREFQTIFLFLTLFIVFFILFSEIFQANFVNWLFIQIIVTFLFSTSARKIWDTVFVRFLNLLVKSNTNFEKAKGNIASILLKDFIDARTNETPLSLMIFSLNKNKHNDKSTNKYNYEEFLEKIHNILPSGYIINNYFDNHFYIVLHTSPLLAQSIAKQIIEIFESETEMSISIGIAGLKKDMLSEFELINTAITALKNAYTWGYNNFIIS